MRPPRAPRRVRGSSFIEILIALAILAIMMVGILQMFALALITNRGSAARTELLYKAQQVVENLRMIYYLQNGQTPSAPAALVASGVPATLAATTTPIFLPYYSGDTTSTLTWAYWGPAGFNIVDAERLPYRIFYTVEGPSVGPWLVTVTATPVDNPSVSLAGTLPTVTDTDNPRRYLTMGSKLKIVTYSAQLR